MCCCRAARHPAPAAAAMHIYEAQHSRDRKGCRPAAGRNTKASQARVLSKRKRPQPADAPGVLAAKDPNFPISMGHGWAERMVVLGPPGPLCSSASGDEVYTIDLKTYKVKKVYEGTTHTIVLYMSFYTPGTTLLFLFYNVQKEK